MSVAEHPGKKIGRGSFAARLAVFLLVGAVLSVGVKVGLSLLAAKASSGHWSLSLHLLALFIGGLGLLTFAIFNAVVFVTRAVIPRLSDIGFYGPMRTWITALSILYPVGILVLLFMLFAPKNFVAGK